MSDEDDDTVILTDEEKERVLENEENQDADKTDSDQS